MMGSTGGRRSAGALGMGVALFACLAISLSLKRGGRAAHQIRRVLMERYVIETEHHVGLSCGLNTEQADKFFTWGKTQEGAFGITLIGAEGQALVVLHQKNTLNAILSKKPKGKNELEKEDGFGCWNRADTKLWDNIECLDEFFAQYHYVASIKIYPKSAVPDDAPIDFIKKKLFRFDALKDQRIKVPPFIADCLREAVHIRDFDKDESEDAESEAKGTTAAMVSCLPDICCYEIICQRYGYLPNPVNSRVMPS